MFKSLILASLQNRLIVAGVAFALMVFGVTGVDPAPPAPDGRGADGAAKPARKGVPNPFKPGELMDVAAKPAKTTIKVRALKGLKDMVS